MHDLRLSGYRFGPGETLAVRCHDLSACRITVSCPFRVHQSHSALNCPDSTCPDELDLTLRLFRALPGASDFERYSLMRGAVAASYWYHRTVALFLRPTVHCSSVALFASNVAVCGGLSAYPLAVSENEMILGSIT